jgi:hypothetical protein
MRFMTSSWYAFDGVSGDKGGAVWQAVSAANASTVQSFTM